MGYKHNIEDILEVGFDVFRRNGYHAVGINQVLKASGIPKGSFYNFFKSKEDFAQQVINRYGINNCKWISDFLSKAKGSALEKISAFYSELITMNHMDDYRGGCLINNINMEVGRNIDALGNEADKHFKEWIKVIAEIINEGQQNGEINKQYDAITIAEYLHSGFYGALSRSKVTRRKDEINSWLKLSIDFIAT